MNIIELKNINKSYKTGDETLHVLKDVSLSVYEGEFISILGPSGCGKSTLMNIIGCMDSYDNGEYFIDGVAVHCAKEKELEGIRNSRIGFIFQKYQLIPRYTVCQNVMLPMLIRGMKWNEAQKIAIEQLSQVGLSHKIKAYPNQLSGGQQQRVAIARALITQPTVLLADEPTGALDSTTGREVLSLFKELNQRGNTIIMITHDINVAQTAKRQIYITDGVLFENSNC